MVSDYTKELAADAILKKLADEYPLLSKQLTDKTKGLKLDEFATKKAKVNILKKDYYIIFKEIGKLLLAEIDSKKEKSYKSNYSQNKTLDTISTPWARPDMLPPEPKILDLDGSNSKCCSNKKMRIVQSKDGGFVTQNCRECGKYNYIAQNELPEIECCNFPMKISTKPRWGWGGENFVYKCQKCSKSFELCDRVPNWEDEFPKDKFP